MIKIDKNTKIYKYNTSVKDILNSNLFLSENNIVENYINNEIFYLSILYLKILSLQLKINNIKEYKHGYYLCFIIEYLNMFITMKFTTKETFLIVNKLNEYYLKHIKIFTNDKFIIIDMLNNFNMFLNNFIEKQSIQLIIEFSIKTIYKLLNINESEYINNISKSFSTIINISCDYKNSDDFSIYSENKKIFIESCYLSKLSHDTIIEILDCIDKKMDDNIESN